MRKNREFPRYGKLIAALMMILTATALSMAQQKQGTKPLTGKIELGRGMGLLTADLMQIAVQSDLFLRFAGKIDLTAPQKKKLEEIYFEFQRYSVRREADLNVTDAELRRLLAVDSVDLSAVRVKVKEIETIQAEATMKKIEIVLQAIETLTHDQHIRVMLLIREAIPPETQSGQLR